VQDITVSSSNSALALCEPTLSLLGSSPFLHRGIRLEATDMVRVVEHDVPVTLAGTITDGDGFVQVNRWSRALGDWVAECFAAEPDGSFEFSLNWDAARFPAGNAWIQLGAVPDDCFGGEGWSRSVPIFVAVAEE